jgi:hypothetical protein
MKAFNRLFSWIIRKRMDQIGHFRAHPVQVQNKTFNYLLKKAAPTEYGQKYGFGSISDHRAFHAHVPLQEYEDAKPWIDRIVAGEQNLLWPTPIRWFAKSSGTTSDKSKFIPVSREAIKNCHFKGGKDLLSMYVHNHPDARLYDGKHLVVGGSSQINTLSHKSYTGDLSAIIIRNLPWWAEIRRTPGRDIALMSNWEEKLEKMAINTMKEDVRIIAGVPSWTLLLLKRILDISGKQHISDVWPRLELFMHGGVSFKPYREQFSAIIGNPTMNYVETYNASEGFFGIQDQPGSEEMLLMLDYGIFYEFIPMDSFNGINSQTVLTISDVEPGVNYAVVISTNGGLWRYILGDTVVFTSVKPYRVQVSGRTKHFINTFGEELIIDNADKALGTVCAALNCSIRDYTAGPVFMNEKGEGGAHQWLIEFEHEPQNLEAFTAMLDGELKKLNSDYEAKRAGNLNLHMPHVQQLPKGTFYDWMKQRDKLGGQNKVPRLYNSRKFLDDILSFVNTRTD